MLSSIVFSTDCRSYLQVLIMDTMVWMFLPAFVAVGSALLCYTIMQARMDVAISKEKETISQVRTMLSSQQLLMEEKVRTAEEFTKRKAMDDLLADIRVEERHYVKESKSLFMNKKSMILQERLYFRNLPLSNWVEHEMVVEEGCDLKNLMRNASVFSSGSIAGVDDSAKMLG